MVLFTDSHLQYSQINQTNAKPYVIIVDLEQQALQRLGQNIMFWQHQLHDMDPERQVHQSYQLYWIWALKVFFLHDAVQLNHFQSSFYVWIDAGIMREKRYVNANLLHLLPPIAMQENNHSIFIGNPFPFEPTIDNIIDTSPCGNSFLHKDRLAGGMFGGHASFIQTWLALYQQFFQKYIECGWFVGKDQSIFNSICIQRPDKCVLIHNTDPQRNPWYSLVYFLLDKHT